MTFCDPTDTTISLRIGPLTVTVVESDLISELGRADFEECRIVLRAGLPPSLRYEVLLHEVLHFAAWLAGVKLGEEKVKRLAPVLAQILTDNVI